MEMERSYRGACIHCGNLEWGALKWLIGSEELDDEMGEQSMRDGCSISNTTVITYKRHDGYLKKTKSLPSQPLHQFLTNPSHAHGHLPRSPTL